MGFIGLGVMGRPMAKHILARLCSGRVNRSALPWTNWSRRVVAGRPADVARRATVIVTMVPDTRTWNRCSWALTVSLKACRRVRS
jgi:2-hydroxy-3-oxopropionate reductase